MNIALNMKINSIIERLDALEVRVSALADAVSNAGASSSLADLVYKHRDEIQALKMRMGKKFVQ